MAASRTSTKIRDVGGVAVPVIDQERALRFYAEKLGLEVRLDVPMDDGGRWLQVAPPGGRVLVSLVAAGEGDPVGVDTGITFSTDDAEAAHASLAWGGVVTDPLLRWSGVPLMFSLRDPDGNQLKIMEPAPR
jgi:predicted enzyme related to lactoylglutathione lyase